MSGEEKFEAVFITLPGGVRAYARIDRIDRPAKQEIQEICPYSRLQDSKEIALMKMWSTISGGKGRERVTLCSRCILCTYVF